MHSQWILKHLCMSLFLLHQTKCEYQNTYLHISRSLLQQTRSVNIKRLTWGCHNFYCIRQNVNIKHLFMSWFLLRQKNCQYQSNCLCMSWFPLHLTSLFFCMYWNTWMDSPHIQEPVLLWLASLSILPWMTEQKNHMQIWSCKIAPTRWLEEKKIRTSKFGAQYSYQNRSWKQKS